MLLTELIKGQTVLYCMAVFKSNIGDVDTPLQRLRTENRLLKQRIDTLEKVSDKMQSKSFIIQTYPYTIMSSHICSS